MNYWPFKPLRYSGFSVGTVDSIIQSDEKMGFPDARTTVSDPVGSISGHLIFDIGDVSLMSDFYETILVNGSDRFLMTDPIDGLWWEWRFISPFSVSALCGGKMVVGISLERIPATGEDPQESVASFSGGATLTGVGV